MHDQPIFPVCPASWSSNRSCHPEGRSFFTKEVCHSEGRSLFKKEFCDPEGGLFFTKEVCHPELRLTCLPREIIVYAAAVQ